MFTGIIEEIGVIKSFEGGNNASASVFVECKKILEDIKLGDSIAINGVCQTVTGFDSHGFSAQISQETLAVTNFSTLKTKDKVNLERALTLSTRLGGHVVTGHIDCTARLIKSEKLGEFYNLQFELKENLEKYIVKKGSITINGISLTVAEISGKTFKVAVIPHTFKNTTLSDAKPNDFVNIEVDILAKYVEKLSAFNDNSKITEGFLAENGFL